MSYIKPELVAKAKEMDNLSNCQVASIVRRSMTA